MSLSETRGMGLNLFFLLAIALPTHGARADDDKLKDCIQGFNLGAFQSVSGPQNGKCGADPTASFEKISVRRGKFSNWTCSDLFSSIPPAAYTHDHENTYDALWWPVCSPYDVELLQKLPDPRAKDKMVVRDSVTLIAHKRDLCEKGAKAMPGSSQFVASKPAEVPQMVVISGSERRTAETLYHEVRAQVTNACCRDKAPGCRQRMESIEMSWCKPQTDPHRADPCIEMGTYYNSSSDFERYKKLGNALRPLHRGVPGKNRFQSIAEKIKRESLMNLRDGIVISPYRWREEKVGLFQSFNALSHELSHACEFVRNGLDMENGSQNALVSRLQGMLSAEHCRLSSQYWNYFEEMSPAVGLPHDVLNCLVGLAAHGDRLRFGNGSCPDACPREHLREGFAEWMALQLALNVGGSDDAILTLCRSRRDTVHPLGPDVFSCALKSAIAVEKLKEISGCREAR